MPASPMADVFEIEVQRELARLRQLAGLPAPPSSFLNYLTHPPASAPVPPSSKGHALFGAAPPPLPPPATAQRPAQQPAQPRGATAPPQPTALADPKRAAQAAYAAELQKQVQEAAERKRREKELDREAAGPPSPVAPPGRTGRRARETAPPAAAHPPLPADAAAAAVGWYGAERAPAAAAVPLDSFSVASGPTAAAVPPPGRMAPPQAFPAMPPLTESPQGAHPRPSHQQLDANMDAEALHAAVQAGGASFHRYRASALPPDEHQRLEERARARLAHAAELERQVGDRRARLAQEQAQASAAERLEEARIERERRELEQRQAAAAAAEEEEEEQHRQQGEQGPQGLVAVLKGGARGAGGAWQHATQARRVSLAAPAENRGGEDRNASSMARYPQSPGAASAAHSPAHSAAAYVPAVSAEGRYSYFPAAPAAPKSAEERQREHAQIMARVQAAMQGYASGAPPSQSTLVSRDAASAVHHAATALHGRSSAYSWLGSGGGGEAARAVAAAQADSGWGSWHPYPGTDHAHSSLLPPHRTGVRDPGVLGDGSYRPIIIYATAPAVAGYAAPPGGSGARNGGVLDTSGIEWVGKGRPRTSALARAATTTSSLDAASLVPLPPPAALAHDRGAAADALPEPSLDSSTQLLFNGTSTLVPFFSDSPGQGEGGHPPPSGGVGAAGRLLLLPGAALHPPAAAAASILAEGGVAVSSGFWRRSAPLAAAAAPGALSREASLPASAAAGERATLTRAPAAPHHTASSSTTAAAALTAAPSSAPSMESFYSIPWDPSAAHFPQPHEPGEEAGGPSAQAHPLHHPFKGLDEVHVRTHALSPGRAGGRRGSVVSVGGRFGPDPVTRVVEAVSPTRAANGSGSPPGRTGRLGLGELVQEIEGQTEVLDLRAAQDATADAAWRSLQRSGGSQYSPARAPWGPGATGAFPGASTSPAAFPPYASSPQYGRISGAESSQPMWAQMQPQHTPHQAVAGPYSALSIPPGTLSISVAEIQSAMTGAEGGAGSDGAAASSFLADSSQHKQQFTTGGEVPGSSSAIPSDETAPPRHDSAGVEDDPDLWDVRQQGAAVGARSEGQRASASSGDYDDYAFDEFDDSEGDGRREVESGAPIGAGGASEGSNAPTAPHSNHPLPTSYGSPVIAPYSRGEEYGAYDEDGADLTSAGGALGTSSDADFMLPPAVHKPRHSVEVVDDVASPTQAAPAASAAAPDGEASADSDDGFGGANSRDDGASHSLDLGVIDDGASHSLDLGVIDDGASHSLDLGVSDDAAAAAAAVSSSPLAAQVPEVAAPPPPRPSSSTLSPSPKRNGSARAVAPPAPAPFSSPGPGASRPVSFDEWRDLSAGSRTSRKAFAAAPSRHSLLGPQAQQPNSSGEVGVPSGSGAPAPLRPASASSSAAVARAAAAAAPGDRVRPASSSAASGRGAQPVPAAAASGPAGGAAAAAPSSGAAAHSAGSGTTRDHNTWGLSPTELSLHRRRLMAFYTVHAPAKARNETVESAFSLFGPGIWDALEEKYAGKVTGFRPPST